MSLALDYKGGETKYGLLNPRNSEGFFDVFAAAGRMAKGTLLEMIII